MKVTFGQFKGKTFEWLFFKAPWYTQWLFENSIHRNANCFTEDESRSFHELYLRASSLTGVCPHCKERPVTQMGLTQLGRTAGLGSVDFYCAECEYLGGGRTAYEHPAFFTFMHWMPRCEKKMITRAIHERYIGLEKRLTRKVMEEFFRNDANFTHGTPGFFEQPAAGSEKK